MPALARSDFQAWVDGARTDLHTLRGPHGSDGPDGPDGIGVSVCKHGAHLVSVRAPDGQGGRTELTLGLPNPQLQMAKGSDHDLLLDAAAASQPSAWRAAQLHCLHNGRRMAVVISEPGLEPMSWPDAPNQPAAHDPWPAPSATRLGEIVYRVDP